MKCAMFILDFSFQINSVTSDNLRRIYLCTLITIISRNDFCLLIFVDTYIVCISRSTCVCQLTC